MTEESIGGPAATRTGTAGEVFIAFLRLGLTSFGGPIAHLGYFRDEFVSRRRWLDDPSYADLVAICQFVPGPASSQVGFALGLMRAGWPGALAAFTAFTLPSALILVAFATWAVRIDGPIMAGALDGLKIVAVAVVAQAVWGMARTLCPDRGRAAIAVLALAASAVVPGPAAMVASILLGAGIGIALGTGAGTAPARRPAFGLRKRTAFAALAVFSGLLIALPLAAPLSEPLAVADAFYRAGALVFGGGHVVLPLLDAELVVENGWVSPDAFLAGYGAAQAVPGPLFTFAAYLGTVQSAAPNGVAGAALALLAIFLPGFLVLVAVLPFWTALSAAPTLRSAMGGANAAVVGILAAALYDPVFTSAIGSPPEFALAAAAFVALMAFRAPAFLVVVATALGGIVLAVTTGSG